MGENTCPVKLQVEHTKLMAETDSRSKSNSHLIVEIKEEVKELKGQNETVIKLAMSVEHLGENVKSMLDEMRESREFNEKKFGEQDHRLAKLEKQGGKVAIWAWAMTFVAIAGALAGKFIF